MLRPPVYSYHSHSKEIQILVFRPNMIVRRVLKVLTGKLCQHLSNLFLICLFPEKEVRVKSKSESPERSNFFKIFLDPPNICVCRRLLKEKKNIFADLRNKDESNVVLRFSAGPLAYLSHFAVFS